MTTRGQSGGLVPGGAAALAGIGFLFGAGLFLDESARHWHVPAALVAGACACFGLAAVQSRRANKSAGARPAAAGRPVTRASLRPALWVFHIGFVWAAALAGYGGYLLRQRNTGPHVAVTVTRCELVDPGGAQRGASAHDYCYGDWTYAGRSYVGKYVQGAGFDDDGHVIDATLHGDTAYSRDLQTPLILLGVFGAASVIAGSLCVMTWRRWRRAPG